LFFFLLNVQEYIPFINELFKDCTETQKAHQPPSSQDNPPARHPQCPVNGSDDSGKMKEKHLRILGDSSDWLITRCIKNMAWRKGCRWLNL